MTEGTDAALFDAVTEAATAAGALYEVVAPKVGGVTLSDGTVLAAKHKVDGGPSVLFDAVAVLPSADGCALLAGDAPSLDFVGDAFAHCKFIGYGADAMPLLEAAGWPTRSTRASFRSPPRPTPQRSSPPAGRCGCGSAN